jgi:hypothetical protein
MSLNAGVWIDHHKAIVVRLTDDGETMQEIQADRESSARLADGSQAPHTYGANDVIAEDKLERKATIQLNKYYDKVFACLREADAILVFGPGEAKGEFVKRLVSKKHAGHINDMKTVDKLTDPQIAAYVREHFRPSQRVSKRESVRT